MLKQPVTISIVRSRLAMAAMVSMALATCLTLLCYGPLWLAATAVIAFCASLWGEWRRENIGPLRWLPGIEGGWQRQVKRTGQWQPVEVRHDYLGPWLVGLHVAGRRCWLWPDSASFEERRALRRVLLWSSSPAGS